MTANSCAECRHYALYRLDFTGAKCGLTGEPAQGLCEQFMLDVGHENCVFTVSPEAEGAFVALASAMGYHVRKVNP